MSETTNSEIPPGKSEVPPGETVTCLYPGCEREAVPPPKGETRRESRQGPPPRFCDNKDHNAASTFREIKRLEKEAAGQGQA